MEANKAMIFIVMAITFFFRSSPENMRRKKQCIIIVTVLLACFSGFRSWRMGDVFHYCYAYLECNLPGWTLNWNSGDTVGYQLFVHIAGQLGLSFEICIFLIAAFNAIVLGVFVYRYSPSPYLSYLMYFALGFYLASFDILKQAIAMSFIILAMMALLEDKLVQFLVFVGIAVLFHQPAAIFVVAYPIAKKKIGISYVVMIAAMVSAVFLFRDNIVELATEMYYEDENSFEASKLIGGKAVLLALILVMALALRPVRQYDTIYRQVFNIIVLATIIQTFSVYDNVFTRLSDYYLQFIVLFVPLMLQSGKERVKLYSTSGQRVRYWSERTLSLARFVITVFSIMFYLSTINNSWALLNGFQFFWEVDAPSSLDLLREMLKS